MATVYFLLVYDREGGKLLVERKFDNRSEALRARFATEKAYRSGVDDVEVVVLGAPSREALMRTHGRYFYSLEELANRARAAVL